MIKAIINASLRDRFMVLVATFIIGAVGIFSYKNVPLDAIPDLSRSSYLPNTLVSRRRSWKTR